MVFLEDLQNACRFGLHGFCRRFVKRLEWVYGGFLKVLQHFIEALGS